VIDIALWAGCGLACWTAASFPVAVLVGKYFKRAGENDAESLRNESAPANVGGFVSRRPFQDRERGVTRSRNSVI
jgi:hypothetical protein